MDVYRPRPDGSYEVTTTPARAGGADDRSESDPTPTETTTMATKKQPAGDPAGEPMKATATRAIHLPDVADLTKLAEDLGRLYRDLPLADFEALIADIEQTVADATT